MLLPALRGLSRRLHKGFTLIELLIVIAIIGVLAAAVFVAVNPAKRTAQARDAERKTNLAQIDTALKSYLIFNGNYPIIGAWACSSGCSTAPGNTWSDLEIKLAPYIKKLPVDPKNNYSGTDPTGLAQTGYTYAYYSNGTTFDLIAFLEDSSDKTACKNKGYIDYVYSESTGTNTYWCAGANPPTFNPNLGRRPEIYTLALKP